MQLYNEPEEEMNVKRRHSTLSMVLAASLVGGALAATPAAAATKLRAGHLQPATSDQGVAIDFFAKRVGELTNGELEVQVFHSAELGKSIPVQLENLVSGAQDFFIETMDYFKVWDDRFGVINTPFVFRDRHDHFRKFLASDLFNDIVATVEERGVVFLGKRKYNWLRAGDRGILSRTPIFHPDDLQGYKMRMFQAEMPIKSWGAFGANIQVIPWADVYTAMATGVADALTTVVVASYDNKHIEVLKYFTNVREYYQIIAPMASRRTWDRLDEGQRAAIEQAAFEAGELYTSTSRKQTVEKTRKAQWELGLNIILPPLKPWHDRMAETHAEFEEQGLLPKGLIAKVKAIE